MWVGLHSGAPYPNGLRVTDNWRFAPTPCGYRKPLSRSRLEYVTGTMTVLCKFQLPNERGGLNEGQRWEERQLSSGDHAISYRDGNELGGKKKSFHYHTTA